MLKVDDAFLCEYAFQESDGAVSIVRRRGQLMFDELPGRWKELRFAVIIILVDRHQGQGDVVGFAAGINSRLATPSIVARHQVQGDVVDIAGWDINARLVAPSGIEHVGAEPCRLDRKRTRQDVVVFGLGDYEFQEPGEYVLDVLVDGEMAYSLRFLVSMRDRGV